MPKATSGATISIATTVINTGAVVVSIVSSTIRCRVRVVMVMVVVGVRGRSDAILAFPPLAAASEKDDDHADEEEDHGSQCRPHAHRVKGVRARAVAVDVVFDDLSHQSVHSSSLMLFR